MIAFSRYRGGLARPADGSGALGALCRAVPSALTLLAATAIHASAQGVTRHPSGVEAATRGCAAMLADTTAVDLAATRDSASVVAYVLTPAEAMTMRLDGALTEAFWICADSVSEFRQREPLEGQPATERTVVRLAYDAHALYVGVMAYDDEPEAVVARVLQRDRIMQKEFFGGGLKFAGDDAVALLIDPFHDHRNAVVFATNPNGAEFEALLTDEGKEVNVDWRGVWRVAAMRTRLGWSAEFRIPWRTLRYGDVTDRRVWGLNVFRVIRRKNEEVLWRSWRRDGEGFQRVSRAGHLLGLRDLPGQGLNLEAKPFVLTGARQVLDDTGRIPTETTGKVGLDLKTELRPGLLLDLTANTDFAQVEVDDEQVNLTRFNLFFPEKRDFFLENAGIFEFGQPGNPFQTPPFLMFFSRRIGIDAEGEVPILGGARLTGRVGDQTVGFLNVLTDAAHGRARENFSVVRVKRDVGERSYLGAMVTDRRSADGWNTVAGIDARFGFSQAWVLDAFVARTSTGGPSGEGFAYRASLDYTGDEWGMFFNHISVEPGVVTSSGFTTRTDLRKTDLFGRHRWRPTALGLRKIDVWLGGNYQTTIDGRLQDWQVGPSMTPEWESGDNARIFANLGETVIDRAFMLSGRAEVPAGTYRVDHVGWSGGTSTNRWIYAETQGRIGDFFGGRLISVGTTLTVAPIPQVNLAVGYTRNDVSIPSESFVADISSVRASYSFSTKLFTNVLVQYNSLGGTFSTNVRFDFIHRPGSDLFLVFTENRGTEGNLWDLTNRGLVMKVTYLARF